MQFTLPESFLMIYNVSVCPHVQAFITVHGKLYQYPSGMWELRKLPDQEGKPYIAITHNLNESDCGYPDSFYNWKDSLNFKTSSLEEFESKYKDTLKNRVLQGDYTYCSPWFLNFLGIEPRKLDIGKIRRRLENYLRHTGYYEILELALARGIKIELEK